MPDTQQSGKLETDQEQYAVSSGNIVYFRVVKEHDGYKLMTATAPEKNGQLQPFADRDRLIGEAQRVLLDAGRDVHHKQDHAGRAYIEARGFSGRVEFVTAATRALDRMDIKDVDVLDLRHRKQLYSDCEKRPIVIARIGAS